MQKHFIINSSI